MSPTKTRDFALPVLKQIIGAMLFVRKDPLPVAEIRRVLKATAERRGGITADFAKADEKLVLEALGELGRDLADRKAGFHLIEVAGGWRLENDANCGPWLRTMLQKGRGTRLSLPALETLAIIAYRQPCVRSEIEAVRGVAVDAILKNLLDLQLVRVVGRSELPGRPWMFGTTQKFMEHFGLKNLDDLPGTDELRRIEAEQAARYGNGRKGRADDGEDAPPQPPEDPNQMKMEVVEKASPDPSAPEPEEPPEDPNQMKIEAVEAASEMPAEEEEEETDEFDEDGEFDEAEDEFDDEDDEEEEEEDEEDEEK
ncbi:MAG: SMC-Scp complex subunit ScpB [Kiritimatiellae bacterium]|nr:SMC-Scp complex subunit ScpB [Kiritimatiellia bacterium]